MLSLNLFPRAARRSAGALERMSRSCPSCASAMPIWRWSGPAVRHDQPQGSSWWRYLRHRLYCRNCGAELRPKRNLFGHSVWVLIGSMFVASLLVARGAVSVATLDKYRGFMPAVFPLACIPLLLAQAKWGTSFTVSTKRGAAE